MERAIARRATLLVIAQLTFLVCLAVFAVYWAQSAHPSERIASHWMQVTMFDPTPWGATFFDKDWGKCPK